MGEIADALRRAREQRPAEAAEETARRPAAPPPGPSGPPRAHPRGAESARGAVAEVSETRGGRVLDSLRPTDPAIAIGDSPFAEACRTLAVRIRSELERRGAISAAIVSATRQEGKTTVLCDLGLALASLSPGREVALVDLDLRKPSLARVLGIPADTGVERVLSGKARLDDVRICVERPAVDVYPAFEPQHAAHELLGLPTFGETIRELERRYATVLVDTSPALPVPDTSLILRQVAVCIPVARSGQTRARLFRQLLEVLPRKQILGDLLNEARMQAYQYQYYGYGEHDDGREQEAGSTPRRARRKATPGRP